MPTTPDEPRTARIRLPASLWERFQAHADRSRLGGRSSVMRRLMHLYVKDKELRSRVALTPDPSPDKRFPDRP